MGKTKKIKNEKTIKKPKEEIPDIVKQTHAFLNIDEAYLLYDLAEKSKGDILEIGAYKGGSTIILAKGLKENYKVYSIDMHIRKKAFKLKLGKRYEYVPKDTSKIFIKNLKRFKVTDKVIPIIKTSEEAAIGWNKPIDILWIDGNHEYDFVRKDFMLWEPYLKKNGIIAFHDTWNPDDAIMLEKNKYLRGPTRLVQEKILNSRRFTEINRIKTITYARKIRNPFFLKNLLKKIKINKNNKNYKYMDRKIGQIGIILKKINPGLYYILKEIKDN